MGRVRNPHSAIAFLASFLRAFDTFFDVIGLVDLKLFRFEVHIVGDHRFLGGKRHLFVDRKI